MKRIAGLCQALCTRAMLLAGDVAGQDLIEYALMAGFVALSAAFAMPTVSSTISTVFSKIGSVMTDAAAS